MPTLKSDLSRRFVLTVAMSGHVFFWERDVGHPEEGTLPVFSTDTKEEAESLIIRHCRRANDGSGLYALNSFSGALDALGDVSDLFRATYENMLAKRKTGKPATDCKVSSP
mgnify:FL=1